MQQFVEKRLHVGGNTTVNSDWTSKNLIRLSLDKEIKFSNSSYWQTWSNLCFYWLRNNRQVVEITVEVKNLKSTSHSTCSVHDTAVIWFWFQTCICLRQLVHGLFCDKQTDACATCSGMEVNDEQIPSASSASVGALLCNGSGNTGRCGRMLRLKTNLIVLRGLRSN